MGCEERERVRLDGLVVLVALPGGFKRTDRELRVLARRDNGTQLLPQPRMVWSRAGNHKERNGGQSIGSRVPK
jgi:hypothetical protein